MSYEALLIPIFVTVICMIVIVISLIEISKLKVNVGISEKVKKRDDILDRYEKMVYDVLENDKNINKERVRYIKGYMLGIIIIILAIGSFFILNLLIEFNDFSITLLLMFWFIVLGSVVGVYTGKYEKAFYDKFLKKTLKKYNKNLSYNHYKGISKSIYDQADLDNYDRYHSEDLIKGKILDYTFWMCDVHTEKKRDTFEKEEKYETSFLGTFAYVDFDKYLTSYLCISSNKIKIFNKYQNVSIDNDEFEKEYDVFCDDEIMAMRILTPAVTTRILDLEEKTGISCEIKIAKKRVYLRLKTGDNFGLVAKNIKDDVKSIAMYIVLVDGIMAIMENIIKGIDRLDI